jgi:Arc/MetJ-type ribon-helix-helix transcriptional regulator
MQEMKVITVRVSQDFIDKFTDGEESRSQFIREAIFKLSEIDRIKDAVKILRRVEQKVSKDELLKSLVQQIDLILGNYIELK